MYIKCVFLQTNMPGPTQILFFHSKTFLIDADTNFQQHSTTACCGRRELIVAEANASTPDHYAVRNPVHVSGIGLPLGIGPTVPAWKAS